MLVSSRSLTLANGASHRLSLDFLHTRSEQEHIDYGEKKGISSLLELKCRIRTYPFQIRIDVHDTVVFCA